MVSALNTSDNSKLAGWLSDLLFTYLSAKDILKLMFSIYFHGDYKLKK